MMVSTWIFYSNEQDKYRAAPNILSYIEFLGVWSLRLFGQSGLVFLGLQTVVETAPCGGTGLAGASFFPFISSGDTLLSIISISFSSLLGYKHLKQSSLVAFLKIKDTLSHQTFSFTFPELPCFLPTMLQYVALPLVLLLQRFSRKKPPPLGL